mmetsp:Transcript_17428/g.31454  ORF Transcript_17428/g.31454 Transcript_17428/m.31454 type:complete len:250 (-) Transcript_17428:7116-7865(-)
MGARLFHRRDNQELLSSLNYRSTDQVSSRSDGTIDVSTVQVEASIVKSSLTLIPISPDVYSLEFCYNALRDCELAVHQWAEEVLDVHNSTLYYATDTQKQVGSQIMKLPQGMLQYIPPKSVIVDLSCFEENSKQGEAVPLVIEISPSLKEMSGSTEATHISFTNRGKGFNLKVTCQKFTKEGHTYEILQLFGTQAHESEIERPECVICLTNIRDTSVLPCGHMCLCHDCANMTRAQSYGKCPICRVRKG